MNRLHYALAALGITVVALAACGGGGSTPPGASTQSAPNGIARHTVTVPSFSSRTSVGTAHITIALPQALIGKKAQAIIRAIHGPQLASVAARRAKSVAGRRSPAYVDPYGCGGGNSCYYAILDVFVDGTLIPNIDGCAGPYDSLCVQPAADGTMNVSLPLFSSSNNDIVVAEFDSCGNDCEDLLALGESWSGSFTPGTGVNASVTLLMNAASIGILDVYNQQDPEIMNGQTYLGLGGTCDTNDFPQSAQFGLYTADENGAFVPVAGYGGISTPVMTYASDPGGTTVAAQTTIPGLYFANWDNNCDGVTVNATATNPAYAIYSSTTDSAGPLDGNGHDTYGYEKCYNGNGPCPGGPYQGLWDMWFPFDEPYYPQYFINGPTVTGSVNILNAPTPGPSSQPSSGPSPGPSASASGADALGNSVTFPTVGGIGAQLTFAASPIPFDQTADIAAYNYLPASIPTNAPSSMPSPTSGSPAVVASWWFSIPNSNVNLGNAGPSVVFTGVPCPAPFGQYYTFFADASLGIGEGYQAQSSCSGPTTVTFTSGANNGAVTLYQNDLYVLVLSYF